MFGRRRTLLAIAIVGLALLLAAIGVRFNEITAVALLVKWIIQADVYAFNSPGTDDHLRAEQTYDFIVVGAGTAGCTIAGRLSERPDWSVLLIEAGPSENYAMDVPGFAMMMQLPDAINWGYRTEPSDGGQFCASMVDGRCKWPRGKVMGGSSVLNYQIYTRGHRNDYDRWSAELGNAGWSFDEVRPYFERAERQVTVSESIYETELAQAVLDGMQQTGLPLVDYNRAMRAGVAKMQHTTRSSMRMSSNRAYIMPFAQQRPNLHTRTRAQVVRVLLDEHTKRARGVEFVGGAAAGGQMGRAFARKEVIISAGAINSPQLLMLSGIGEAKHLRSVGIRPLVDAPQVGQNLMDHVTPGVLQIITNSTRLYLKDMIKPQTWWNYLRTGGTFISTPGFSETVTFAGPDRDYPDVELLEVTGGLYASHLLGDLFNMRPDIYASKYAPMGAMGVDVLSIYMFALRPKSRGHLRLASADPLAHPHIHPNYFAHPDDMLATLRGVQQVRRLLETPAMRRFDARLADTTVDECRPHLNGRRGGMLDSRATEYWRCQARHLSSTVYHYAGTCRMGPNASETVVDAQLRVHGALNLRVADASVMPDMVSGHTNAPVYMIGEKAADMIRQAWSTPAV